MTVIEYLNFFEVFVNEVVGDALLFVLIGIALIFAIGVMNKMAWMVLMMLGATFLMFLSAVYINIYFPFIILGIGLIFYLTMRNIWQRS